MKFVLSSSGVASSTVATGTCIEVAPWFTWNEPLTPPALAEYCTLNATPAAGEIDTGKVVGLPSAAGAIAFPIDTSDDGGSMFSSVPVAGVESTVVPSIGVRSVDVSVTVNVRGDAVAESRCQSSQRRTSSTTDLQGA